MYILNNILLRFVPKGPIDNRLAFVPALGRAEQFLSKFTAKFRFTKDVRATIQVINFHVYSYTYMILMDSSHYLIR